MVIRELTRKFNWEQYKIDIQDIYNIKSQGGKFAAVACYDYTTAVILNQTPVEMALVGDSAAQHMLGFKSTLPAKMDFMVEITAAVGRGAPNLCLAADMPFMSYQTSIADAVKNAARFVVEAGADIVKIEITEAYLDVVKAVSNAGIAVMPHIGIRPQSGVLRAQGRTAEKAVELVNLAEKAIEAGASMLLLEGTAAEVAKVITERSPIPVIGCGSGPFCDGDILIAPDILGLTQGRMPKFSKSFADLVSQMKTAFTEYAQQVKEAKFPDDQHSYHIKTDQAESFKKIISDIYPA